MIWLYIILSLIAVFIVIIMAKTLMFKPKAETEVFKNEEAFDRDKAVENLQTLVRFKTISYRDKSKEDDNEFEGLIKKLPELYPNVFEKCEFKRLPDRALLFKWGGAESGKPTVLMAHYDVVPVNEELWDKPAFDGILENGVLWGRGTLDTKVTFNGVLFSVNHLISQGFTPKNDIYLAFSGGEEINGNGAKNIVDYFEENNIELSLVVDEGGAVVENVFPGVKTPCGLIGIAEKGMVDVKYEVESAGGHASAPKPHTPVGVLSQACCKIENHPFKTHITKPVREMFDTLGRHSTFLYRMIFANLWVFSPVLALLGKIQGGEMNALLRTTVAFTQMQGSDAANVIPPKASMVSNIRLNPSDSVDSALDYLKKTINDDSIKLSVISSMEPSRISQTNCDAYNKVAKAVASTWKGCITSPYLMVQCSDSRHYGRISDKVYRFSAMDLTSEERATIHGNNERIRVEAIHRATEFYIRLIKQC